MSASTWFLWRGTDAAKPVQAWKDPTQTWITFRPTKKGPVHRVALENADPVLTYTTNGTNLEQLTPPLHRFFQEDRDTYLWVLPPSWYVEDPLVVRGPAYVRDTVYPRYDRQFEHVPMRDLSPEAQVALDHVLETGRGVPTSAPRRTILLRQEGYDRAAEAWRFVAYDRETGRSVQVTAISREEAAIAMGIPPEWMVVPYSSPVRYRWWLERGGSHAAFTAMADGWRPGSNYDPRWMEGLSQADQAAGRTRG